MININIHIQEIIGSNEYGATHVIHKHTSPHYIT